VILLPKSFSITNSLLFLIFSLGFSWIFKAKWSFSLSSLSIPLWSIAPKPIIGKNYQNPTMSLQIVTFIVIGYYFLHLGIFLMSIFNGRYQNLLIYTSVPFFPHKLLPLKFNSHFEPFLFFWHFRTFIFKNLFANQFSEF